MSYLCFFPNLTIIRGDTSLYSPAIAYQQNPPCKVSAVLQMYKSKMLVKMCPDLLVAEHPWLKIFLNEDIRRYFL